MSILLSVLDRFWVPTPTAHFLIMLLSLLIRLRGPEVEICLCFLVVLCWLVGSRGRFRFPCVVGRWPARSPGAEEGKRRWSTHVMGRVTRGRGGRYPKGKVVRRQKEVARQPEDCSKSNTAAGTIWIQREFVKDMI